MQYQDISQVWQNQNQDIKSMSQAIPLDLFALDRLQRCLATQFKVLCFMTQTQQHVQKLYKNPQQFAYNRHSNFMSFEPTRVIVGKQENHEKAESYLNANFVEIDGKKAIATQGPLTTTFYNFWRAVEENQVKSIFMLCALIQKNKIKCDRYYPHKENEGKIEEKEYEVTLLEESTNNLGLEEGLKVRKLKLKNTLTNKQQEITHYQITDWSDGDKPTKKSHKKLSFLVNQFISNLHNSIPLVHCSAGVGRTGTFLAMALFRLLIQKGGDISIFAEVRKLKQQRWGLVYSLSQYEFLYDFVEKEIRRAEPSGTMSDYSSDSDDD